MVSDDGDLLRDRKVVGLRIVPVNQPDRLGVFAHPRLDSDAVTQEAIDILIGLVEVSTSTERSVAP